MRTYLTYQERQRLYRDYKDYHNGLGKVLLFFGMEIFLVATGIFIGYLIFK